MAIIKGKSAGGSGGKRGHSNMDHWMFTDEIKAAAKQARRIEAKKEIASELRDNVAVKIDIEKPKLPIGFSYALKSSLLQKALDGAKIECHVHLVYWRPQSGHSVLEAEYWLPNANVPYPRVYVRAGVVPSTIRKAAIIAMEEKILPAFTHWLSRVLALSENSPALHDRLYFHATHDDGEVAITSNFVPQGP